LSWGHCAVQVVGAAAQAFDPAARVADQWRQVPGVGVQEHAVAVVEDEPGCNERSRDVGAWLLTRLQSGEIWETILKLNPTRTYEATQSPTL
jgi:hypothetical protein